MKYGIGHLSVVPCRAEASDSSEQVTQLLFGETIKIYEKRKSWYRIKTNFDQYECWIDEKQFTFINQSTFETLNASKPISTSDLLALASSKAEGFVLPIPLGSNLPFFEKGEFELDKDKFQFDGATVNTSTVSDKSKITENAYMLLNAPYQWGGRSPFGIDCSGFVQIIYKLNGIYLPRDAYQQAEMGQTLSFIEEAEEGDLAFFDNEEGKITHVGIILSNNRIIHASGKVRIDKLDHQGIFNLEKRDYTHRLRLISKIF